MARTSRLWLQRVLPVEGDDTVEVMVDDGYILFEVTRAADGRFHLHVGPVPEDAELDLDELRRLLDEARDVLVKSAGGTS